MELLFDRNRTKAFSKLKINPVEAPVSEGLILICDKCGKKLESKSEENPARELQSELKEQGKRRFGKGKIRTVLTSCMDLCPKGEIAVAILKNDSPFQNSQFFTVSAETKNTAEFLINQFEQEHS
jgi:predicted metal-binding protein